MIHSHRIINEKYELKVYLVSLINYLQFSFQHQRNGAMGKRVFIGT